MEHADDFTSSWSFCLSACQAGLADVNYIRGDIIHKKNRIIVSVRSSYLSLLLKKQKKNNIATKIAECDADFKPVEKLQKG